LAQGGEQLASADYAGCVETMTQVLQLDPSAVQAYGFRGAALFVLGRYQECADDNTQVLEVDPTNDNALSNRANARNHVGDSEGALDDYNQALEINPGDPDNHAQRGTLLYTLGAFEESIADFNAVLAVEPTNSVCLSNRGMAYKDLGDFESAHEDLKKAIELEPDNTVYMFNHAAVLFYAKRYPEAVELNSFLIKADPNSALAFVNRANAYNKLGDHDKAIEDYSSAIKLDSGDFDALYNRGLIYHQRRDFASAAEDYSRAIEISPNVPILHFGRSQARASMGELDAALADMDKAISLDQANANSLLVHRGNLHARNGSHKAAIDDFSRVLTERADPVVLMCRGMSLAATGDFSKAMSDLDEALNQDHADVAGIQLHRANILNKAGESTKAIEAATAAINVQPSAQAHVFRLIARLALGEFEEAEADHAAASRMASGDTALEAELRRLRECVDQRKPPDA